MPFTSYPEFFRQATSALPFPYQERLATAFPLLQLLHVPTSAGKTAAATLSWLWRRRFHPDPAIRQSTPRRLVYCLPMRILVEQTRNAISLNLTKLGLANEIPIHVLMGGEADDEWTVHPDQDAILIGTQDMLLSRALNRGYGLSRFRWPQAFALLHNDVQWVFDEVQLFGAGLPTTAQLEAFRNRFGTYGPAHSLWMSATLQPDWLKTVDFPVPGEHTLLRLTEADYQYDDLKDRLHAVKPLHALTTPQDLAKTISLEHKPGTITLVIVNTVKRAQALYIALGKVTSTRRLLLHSRYRPKERAEHIQTLTTDEDLIVVSTSVVEAGVNVSARLLITEVAPWASLVQRFGRCNRFGEFADAAIYWLDVEDKHAAPYRPDELAAARALLFEREGQSMSPAALPTVTLPAHHSDVIRRRDLLDLFDTTPDLTGNDIDVARFIRDNDDQDVLLCWRPIDSRPAVDMDNPDRNEICPAPLSEVREFLKTREAWLFDHLDDRWRKLSSANLRPGLVLVLPTSSGGYSPELGWDPTSNSEVTPVTILHRAKPEAMPDDPLTEHSDWIELAAHTDHVVAVLHTLLTQVPIDAQAQKALRRAARWHDAGKAHHIFQTTLLGKAPEIGMTTAWAKAPRNGKHHNRPHFRHELASALALLQQDRAEFLPAYLAGASHGRVRLSIRALDGEMRPTGDQKGGRFALGIWDGDVLGPVDLGGDEQLPVTRLDLRPMEMGVPIRPDEASLALSWTEQALALREQYGPFRLAYLEALLRAADVRASKQAREEGAP